MIPIAEIANQLDGKILIFHPTADSLRLMPATRDLCTFIGSGKSKLSKYMSAAHKIRGVVAAGLSISVYAPHPYNPLSNYLLFSVKGVEKNIYQDGILNYYDAMTPPMSGLRFLGRSLRAASMALPYKKFSGHLSGVQSFQAYSGYFTHPEKVVLRSSFHRLLKLQGGAQSESEERDQKASCGVTLFLDQPIERSLSVECARDARAAAVMLANKLGKPVMYKPHHDQGRVNSMQSNWKALSADEKRMPAEVLIRSKTPCNVVGFYSSALGNIRAYDKNICCYAVGANAVAIQINGEHSTLGELLSGLGVITVDVDS